MVGPICGTIIQNILGIYESLKQKKKYYGKLEGLFGVVFILLY